MQVLDPTTITEAEGPSLRPLRGSMKGDSSWIRSEFRVFGGFKSHLSSPLHAFVPLTSSSLQLRLAPSSSSPP